MLLNIHNFINYSITNIKFKRYMKKNIIMLVALLVGAFSSFAQGGSKDSVYFDKSFMDAGTSNNEPVEYTLVPKYFKAGELTPEQPIALIKAKKEAMELAKARPTPLRRDCLNIIYTVDPQYNDAGAIIGTIKGTILIKWSQQKRIWTFSYLKYQLTNIDQNAIVFKLEAE